MAFPNPVAMYIINHYGMNVWFIFVFVPLLLIPIFIVIWYYALHPPMEKFKLYLCLFSAMYLPYASLLISLPYWAMIPLAPVGYFLGRMFVNSMMKLTDADMLGIQSRKENKKKK